MPTVCLNMIVRDESAVIQRALDSVAGIIDYWVICDTGSTDDTPDLICDYFSGKGLPGELHHDAWQDFGHNRSQALARARGKGDYLLLIDADMVMHVDAAFDAGSLDADGYLLLQRNGELAYRNLRLLRNDLDWYSVGVTHEYYASDIANHPLSLDSLWVEDIGDGGSKQNKFTRDIQLLEAGLRQDPGNARYHFYLGQSYRDVGQVDKAIAHYRQRIDLGGWDEETWYARLMLGKCLAGLQRDDEALATLQAAFDERPWRAEPLSEICDLLLKAGDAKRALDCAQLGESIPYPANDSLFIDTSAYAWRFDYLVTLAAYAAGDIASGRDATERLLGKREVPDWVRQTVAMNQRYYIRTLTEITATLLETRQVEPVGQDLHFINPSVLGQAQGYLANLRGINYRHTGHGYYRLDSNEPISELSPAVTRNFLQHLDIGLHPVGPAIELGLDETTRPDRFTSAVIGYEDGRLIEHNGNTWLLTTSREHHAENVNCMAMLHLDGNSVDRTIILHGYEDHLYQKNWMPFVHEGELLLVYGCDPLTILRPDLDSGYCEVVRQSTPPVYCGRLRGGSQGIAVDDHYLFVVHEVVDHAAGRHYYHRLLVLDNALEFAAISEAFYLQKLGIEFVAGLGHDTTGQNLIIAWGEDDEQAFFGSLPFPSLDSLFER